MTTVANAMTENRHRAFRSLAISLSLIVYCAGLLHTGVRSYTLFAATIEAWLLPLAIIGIVALELTAIALPLAIHFWTAPGPQRLAALGFYVFDLALMASNAILDAAKHSGAELSGLLIAYGEYVMPALPLLCMAGWSLIWLLDPASRERDMRESVRAATHEALLSQIQKAVEQADVSQAVENAASETARALVSETLGNTSSRAQLPSKTEAAQSHSTTREMLSPPADWRHESDSEWAPVLAEPEPVALPVAQPRRPVRNGRNPKTAQSKPDGIDPKG